MNLLEKVWGKLGRMGLLNWVPDKPYLQITYHLKFGYKLNLKHPETFNEKLQWLKLYDRKPIYSTMVDKYEAKKYVASIIGEEYIIPTLGVWDKFDDIDFDTLPEQFVLKCTHDSGGLVICKDKSKLDMDAARHKIEKNLKTNYYKHGREWPYKNVKPRIIAEKYMVDESGYELKDYKFFCFDGFAKAMFIASDRQLEGEETKFDFYDLNFTHLPFTNGHPNSDHEIKRPESFDKMKQLAGNLSEGIPHVRVDFYDINGEIYFGELTFAHWSGMVPFEPKEWDKTFGEWIKLPEKWGGYFIASKGYILWVHEKLANEQDEKVQKDNSLKDYKFFCFNGMAKCYKVDFDRFIEHHANYYDMEKNLLSFGEVICPPDFDKEIVMPENFEKMAELADKISKNIPFLRADFYNVDGKIYFGEMTFFPASGFGTFIPKDGDMILGKWLKLPGTCGGGYCLLMNDIIISFKDNNDILKNKKVYSSELKDYKIWCFNGDPRMTLVCTDRFSEKGLHEDFFDMDWKHIAVKRPGSLNAELAIHEPRNYTLMQELAKKLSCNIPFVRIDFYEIYGQVYFGEITFFPASGFKGFIPEKWDETLGNWIHLEDVAIDTYI